MMYLNDLFIGLALSSGIAALAYRRGSLGSGGALGAVIIGTCVFGFGGWTWGLILITFFVSSSALSHFKESQKAELAEKFAKGHRRDLVQTMANGGAAALLSIAYAIWPEPALCAAYLGAVATVNADTWGTELGVLNPSPPRLITTGRAVAVGTSGAISGRGTLASAAGAVIIGLAALFFSLVSRFLDQPDGPVGIDWLVPIALLGGLMGSFADSLLGASVQAMYYCPVCEKQTEKTLHSCGTATAHVRGWQRINNDAVNFLSSLVGALTAWAALKLF